jgi:hypothetical protein
VALSEGRSMPGLVLEAQVYPLNRSATLYAAFEQGLCLRVKSQLQVRPSHHIHHTTLKFRIFGQPCIDFSCSVV